MFDSVSAGQPTHDPETTQTDRLDGTFVEIVGHVVGDSAIKLLRCLNLDSDKELGRLHHPRILPHL